MILVDTSVWIDHFHKTEPLLVGHLEEDEIASHPMVQQELAVGSIRHRKEILTLLKRLHPMPTLLPEEVMALIENHSLWGRGLGVVDVHLAGSVMLTPGARLWTRDKRLHTACQEMHIDCIIE
jgi:toxin